MQTKTNAPLRGHPSYGEKKTAKYYNRLTNISRVRPLQRAVATETHVNQNCVHPNHPEQAHGPSPWSPLGVAVVGGDL